MHFFGGRDNVNPECINPLLRSFRQVTNEFLRVDSIIQLTSVSKDMPNSQSNQLRSESQKKSLPLRVQDLAIT
jgi:hypothetical protein